MGTLPVVSAFNVHLNKLGEKSFTTRYENSFNWVFACGGPDCGGSSLHNKVQWSGKALLLVTGFLCKLSGCFVEVLSRAFSLVSLRRRELPLGV